MGTWSQEERKAHIKILELKAVYLAILSFTKFKIVHRIRVQMDNKVALNYLLKMRGALRTSWSFQSNIGFPGVEEDHNYYRAPTRSSKCDSKLRVLQTFVSN